MDSNPDISLRRLGKIVEDSASEAYVFTSDDFKFVLVNRGARQNLGYSMEELRHLTPWDLKPEYGRDKFIEMVAPLYSGEKTQLDFETVHRRKDGTDYDVSVYLQLMQMDDDAMFYAAIRDVTEQNSIKNELMQTSRQLDAILKNTVMSVFLMDEKQQCIFMNKAAEILTGYSLSEVQGNTLHSVIHHSYPDGRPFPIEECEIDRAFPHKHKVQGEEVFVHKDGSFYPVAFTASPILDETGEPYGTIIEVHNIEDEISARNAKEEYNARLQKSVDEAVRERKAVEAQLVQAQKMEAVGQLTGGVAHDFNNLLQVVGGNIEMLKRDMGGGSEKNQLRIENVRAAVERGSKLASQLLAFGRQQPLEPKAINIARICRGMDDMLRHALGDGIEIETVVGGGLWNCLADPAQVENAILNLALNARDAMDHRGKLTIEAGNAELDEAYGAGHNGVSAGQYVMLAITDTGSGIAENNIEKVFEPFFTTKPAGVGTGLGLSMVYGFIKQSGGHIKIYSEVGEGTTVRLYLPKTLHEEENAPVLGARPIKGGSETILVVEDDEAVRATAIEVLFELGYQVLEASNADSALPIIKSGMKIDLLFTDVVMPGKLRSTELARIAQQVLPEIGVLFTSGYTQNAIVHAGRLDDDVELLSKPYTRDRLAQKVRDVFDKLQTSGERSDSVPLSE